MQAVKKEIEYQKRCRLNLEEQLRLVNQDYTCFQQEISFLKRERQEQLQRNTKM